MKRFIIPLAIAASFFLADFTLAQNNDITLKLESHSMKIDGTSNVRDWHGDVNKINAEAVLKSFNPADLSTLTADHFKTMELRIPVSEIESDSRRLTRNMQDYLKINSHPVITFSLSDIQNVEVNGSNSANITANGVIRVAGSDQNVTMNLTAEINSGTITFSGSQDLLMTDFGIVPPTAVMGTVRARDEIRIDYTLTFSTI